MVISAVTFLTIILILNRELFKVPIFEYTDFAANAIQIERAKHFRELLGNYSRWGFHHPGPAFFYFFAFSERMLHDWLHLVPAEMNAHIVGMIALNTAFLFGAIGIMAKHCRSRLFPPAAALLSIWFIHIVGRTITFPGSAPLSIWMPHVLLFCFLFFVTVCTSVASGESSQMPWLVFSGLMLIHAHVAQVLFVGVLSVAALAALWWRDGRLVGWREFFVRTRKSIVISVALVVLFSFPIMLDVVLHRDNNIRAILHHAKAHQGMQQSFLQSLRYAGSFLAFVPDPEIVLQVPSAKLVSIGGSKPYVVVYWCMVCLMVGMVAGIYCKTRETIPRFIGYAAFQILLIFLLFYYWTLKMAGPLANFNGYFFFCVQLFGLWLLAWLILDGLGLTVRPLLALVLCAMAPLPIFAAKQGFLNTEKGEFETGRLVAKLPRNNGSVFHLTFDSKDWMLMVGVASRMKHQHVPFCVDDADWFVFGRDNVCRQFAGLDNLILTGTPRRCEAPCRIFSADPLYELEVEPYPSLKLPFTIKPDDLSSLNKGFNDGLGVGSSGPVWSKGLATIYFRLAPNLPNVPRVRMRIFGSANPGRPARFLLNGHELGTLAAGQDSGEFLVDRAALFDGDNQLVIQVDKALAVPGDPYNDPRVLGFLFVKVEFEAASF